MAEAWTEKYRPQTLKEIVGNGKALEELRAWADSWERGLPEKKAAILAGEPGVGKTTAAHALARDMGWGVVELNASDARNYDAIKRIAGRGAVNRSLFGMGGDDAFTVGKAKRQLVILDEADNLFGNEDRGGMKAITEILKATGQPILLIANDYYELTRSGAALKSAALTIKFTKVFTRSIPKALKRIADAENVRIEPEALEMLAERAGGDMRSAVNDLAALAIDRPHITAKDVEALGTRDSKGDVWGLLGKVFYGSDIDEARKAAWDVDEDPETLSLWIDENLPIRYTDKADLVEGYHWLSRADVYLGRKSRRMQYGLWGYATELMTGGVAVAKTQKPAGGPHAFPGWLRKMSQSRGVRGVRDRAAAKIGAHTHTSKRTARDSHFPLFRALMAQDDAFAVWAIATLKLEPDEVAFLLETKETSARVKKLMAAAETRMGEMTAARPAPRFGGLPAGFGDDDEAEPSTPAPAPVPAATPTKAPAKPAATRGRKKKEAAGTPEPAAAEAEAPEAAPKPDAEPAPSASKQEALDGGRKQKSLFDY